MKRETFSDDKARGSRDGSKEPNKHLLDASTSHDEYPGPSGSAEKRTKLNMTENDQIQREKDPQEDSPPDESKSSSYTTDESTNASDEGSSNSIYQQPSRSFYREALIYMLQIGSWIKLAQSEGDILASIHSTETLVWEIFEDDKGETRKIVIQWSNILAINANIIENQPGILEIELIGPPLFFKRGRGFAPWEPTEDFTDNQASLHRRHYLQFSLGTLEMFFQNHFQSEERWLQLICRLPFPTIESPYFGLQRHIGAAVNLVLTPYGGTIIYVESTRVKQRVGNGRVVLKRNLGQPMNQSAQIAVAVASRILREHEPDNNFLNVSEIEIDFPSTASPSAGCTMITSIVSLAMQKPVKMDLAMCGRVDGSGKIHRIDKVRELTIGARRKNLRTLIFPLENREELNDLAFNEKEGINFHFVDSYSQIYDFAFVY